MINEITKDKEFYILTRSIDNAEKCRVIDSGNGCFTVELKNSRKYEAGETAELFSITPKSRLYFETAVKEASGCIITLWFPLSVDYLQRREYFRIPPDDASISFDAEEAFEAEISDISAGGLKIITNKPLELLKVYKIGVSADNKHINTDFIPVRIEASEKGFISSGKFENISLAGKTALIQYCFRKQIEHSYL